MSRSIVLLLKSRRAGLNYCLFIIVDTEKFHFGPASPKATMAVVIVRNNDG